MTCRHTAAGPSIPLRKSTGSTATLIFICGESYIIDAYPTVPRVTARAGWLRCFSALISPCGSQTDLGVDFSDAEESARNVQGLSKIVPCQPRLDACGGPRRRNGDLRFL